MIEAAANVSDTPSITVTRKALITGISGQDGYYLSKLLLGKGYQVVGVDRCSGGRGAWRLEILQSELDSEARWDELFARSPELLEKLAAEAIAEDILLF